MIIEKGLKKKRLASIRVTIDNRRPVEHKFQWKYNIFHLKMSSTKFLNLRSAHELNPWHVFYTFKIILIHLSDQSVKLVINHQPLRETLFTNKN